MNDEKIDLSVLDPSRDEERWERLVESVASRAWSARRRRLTVGNQLTAWARPGLAIAAAVAIAVWAGALTSAEKRAAATGSQAEPAFVLAGWAVSDQVPETSKILEVLGGSNGSD